MTYSEKLKDPRWQKVRLEVMDRDGFTCRDCGSNQNTLHVHHCHYAKGSPWNTPTRFLLTLCDSCHSSREMSERILKEEFAMLLIGLNAIERGDLFNSLENYSVDLFCERSGKLRFTKKANK